MNYLYRISLISVFSFLSTSIYAQNIQELQQEISKAEMIIKQTTEQLNSNKTTQQNRREKLLLINNNITTRRNLISKLDSEVRLYNRNISSTSGEIKNHEKRIAALKEQYSHIITESYRQLKQNNYMKFILSADSFHEIFRRLYYLRLHTNTSTTVVLELSEQMALLSEKTKSLNSKRSSLKNTLSSKQKEVNTLSSEQTQFNNELKKLKSSEKNLSSVITKNYQIINKLQDEIKRIIEEEARKNKGEQTEETKQVNIKLSSIFTENKGKFPMPITGGIIFEKFGVHAHPLQKGITVNNKGVNISASGTANVNSIFEGEVSKIFFFNGIGNNVMIRHGNYISVYSNLSTVSVKVGQKVKTFEKIGQIKPKNGSNSSILHFELWHETTPQNPEIWLK